jgi:hypothetical protein
MSQLAGCLSNGVSVEAARKLEAASGRVAAHLTLTG